MQDTAVIIVTEPVHVLTSVIDKVRATPAAIAYGLRQVRAWFAIAPLIWTLVDESNGIVTGIERYWKGYRF